MQRLPEEIPHRQALISAGFTNYAVLRNHRSIESIRGLSRKDAKEVKQYLQGGSEESEDYPIHKGGGYYELSNGEQIRGKKNAVEAQKEL